MREYMGGFKKNPTFCGQTMGPLRDAYVTKTEPFRDADREPFRDADQNHSGPFRDADGESTADGLRGTLRGTKFGQEPAN